MQAARQPEFPATQRGHFSFRTLFTGQLLFLLGLLPVAVITVGCGELATVAEQAAEPDNANLETPPEAESPAGAEAPAGGTENPKPEADAAVSVSLAPWGEILKAAKAEGRPAILDVWSLGCEPCLKEFPGLVRLNQQWGEQLHCVSANIDFDGRKTRPPESYQSKVMDFLRLKDATLDNYLSTTPSDEIYTELKIDSIPAVLIFDAEGKEVARFVDAGETLGFTYEKDIIPFVREMLSGKPAPADEAAPAGGE